MKAATSLTTTKTTTIKETTTLNDIYNIFPRQSRRERNSKTFAIKSYLSNYIHYRVDLHRVFIRYLFLKEVDFI